jgi:hypothetical protein
VEPEVAEAATAGRRATVGLCTEFWRRAEADGLVAEVADPRRLAVVSDLLVCAHTVVHRRHTTAGPRRHIGHSSSTPSPTLARPHQFWQIR